MPTKKSTLTSKNGKIKPAKRDRKTNFKKNLPEMQLPKGKYEVNPGKMVIPQKEKTKRWIPNPSNSFSHLSLMDLIEARDLFHAHLINKKNVVATAIGRYLIRKDEIDEHGIYVPKKKKEARTLENSVVIDISWPCIIVFVDQWEEQRNLIKDGTNNIVPKTIYMPDGRVVPVCIVLAAKNENQDTTIDISTLRFPTNFIGGGFPLIINSQGIERIASVGCIVTNGNKYYALTNKHVSGEEGEIVKTKWGSDEPARIGISCGNALGKIKFSELYDGWNSRNMLVNCDAGLVEIDDLNRWKTDIVGIPQMDEMVDLNTLNFTLSLISEHSIMNGKLTTRNGKIKGYGAASGIIEGEISALFYRYKSIGGDEYVSDFLIRGRNGEPLNLHHGDSGTILLLETVNENGEEKLQPLALHWGQHEFISQNNKNKYTYSLATCLSNICRNLDVEIVRGWNIDSDYSWGKVGHYTVGNAAVDAISESKLKKLMDNNLENISFQTDSINKELTVKDNPALSTNPETGFCPLADVPDIIWKQYKVSADGTRGSAWGRKGDENLNHYADADAPTKNGGKTLFDLCDSVPKMNVQTWINFYNSIDNAAIGLDPKAKVNQGLICFRVWQIYDYMVKAATKGDVKRFIFAGGVLAHYVGDACQPLHSSYMSDGDPADNESIMYTPPRGGSKHPKGVPYAKTMNAGSGVHVAYEDHMIDDYIDQILPALKNNMKNNKYRINQELIIPINSGQEAAFATLNLMQKTQQDIHPKDIVEAYKKVKGNDNISEVLYDQFGERTVDCLARGSRYLAAIWEAAWNCDGNKIASTAAVNQDDLSALYADPNELPSMNLETITPLLK